MPIKLNEYKKTILKYEDLPLEVKSEYGKECNKIKWGERREIICKSLDEDFLISHEYTGMDDGLFVLALKGPNHHFYINQQHFTLRSNKGHPFILNKKKLYYSDNLNLNKSNFMNSNYIEVDLGNKLVEIH